MVCLALFGQGVPAARATETVVVELEAHPARVAVSDQIQITVTIKVGSRVGSGIMGGPSFTGYRLPGLDDFEVLRSWNSSSTQISIAGGRAQREEISSFFYSVRSRKAGRFTISPASVSFGGRTHTSNSLTIQVDPGGAAPPPTLPGQAPSVQDDDEVFIQVVPDKTSAFVGEQVTVTWYLYTRTSLARQPEIKTTPNTDPFFSEDLPFRSQDATRTTINGTIYALVPIYRRALFPLKAGRLKVGPMTVEVMTVGQSYYSMTAVQRSSAELFVEAKVLPAAGKPPGFVKSNVGRFRVTAEAEPSEIDAQSATSLRVTVTGQGFIHGLKVEKLQHLDDFRIRFAGQKTEMAQGIQLSGARVNEYVLIPNRTGALKVPPICFPHFDPTLGTYVTDACSKALTVRVTGELPQSRGAIEPKDNELQRTLKPILHGSTLVDRNPWRLHRSPLGWPVILFPLLSVLGLLVVRRVRARIAEDTEGQQRREARGRAKRRLRLAAQALRSGDRVVFFGEIANALQEQLSARLGVNVRGLTTQELQRLLAQSVIPRDLADGWIQSLEECDFARFAPAAASGTEMEEMLDRTRRLLAKLERTRLPKRESSAEEAVA